MTRALLLAPLVLLAACSTTPVADRIVYRSADAPSPGLDEHEPLDSDAPPDRGGMSEQERREWVRDRDASGTRRAPPAPRYDQTLAPRVVERVRVVHVDRPVVDAAWLPLTLGFGYLAYRHHRHHWRRHHHRRHHVHVGYHWGWHW